MKQNHSILFVVHNLNKANWIPIGVASLIGTLESSGYTVHLVCPEQDNIFEAIETYRPDVVGYSVLTGSHLQYLETNRKLKAVHKFISIFGGPHPTFFPEIIESDGVDAVCIGEGEIALLDFLERLGTPKLIETHNFWIKQDGIVHRNTVRPLIDCLDDLPLPNYEIFYRNFRNLRENPVKHFLVSRGCPYDCTYCFNHGLGELYKDKGQRVRLKSPEYVIREIQSVTKQFPFEYIYFRDDIFISKLEWLEKFITLYKREIGIPFICQLRIEMISEKLIQLLISAGCMSISLGVETGNEKFRRKVLNRSMSNEKILSACTILKKFGVPFCVNNMVGLPGETLPDLYETLSLTQKIKPSYSWFHIYQPYPRTDLAIYACELGLFDGDYDKVFQSCHEKTVLNFSEIQQRRVNNAHKLFALAVEWPWLSGLIKWLVLLPENILYISIFAIGQYYFPTHRLFPQIKMSTRDWVRGFWNTLLITQPSLSTPARDRAKKIA